MRRLTRRLVRLALLTALAISGLIIQLAVFPLVRIAHRRVIIAGWSTLLLRACGLVLVVRDEGAAAGRPLAAIAPGRMLVANHLSWLDIFAINAIATSAFVAKAELRSWPLAGWLAALAGTVFIERGRRHAVHRVIETLKRRIRERFPVALFPEATTTDGSSLLPFHGNLLEAAVAEGAEVVPIALRYLDGDGKPAAAALFVGDTTFVASIWSVLGASGLRVEVDVLVAEPADGRNRHELAKALHARLSRRLGGC
ncbi:MAG: lysophospholipid acyltransferase family protein [Lautropia sp.]